MGIHTEYFSLADFDVQELNSYFTNHPIVKRCELVSSDRDEEGIDFTLKIYLKGSSKYFYTSLTDQFDYPGVDVMMDVTAVQSDPNPKMFPSQRYVGVVYSYEELADKIDEYFLSNVPSKACGVNVGWQDDEGFEVARRRVFGEKRKPVNKRRFAEDVEEYDPPLEWDKLPQRLRGDEVHAWRAKTGIELIHREPTFEELQRIWKNWNLMDDEMKAKSDKKSLELFGKTNKENYEWLLQLY